MIDDYVREVSELKDAEQRLRRRLREAKDHLREKEKRYQAMRNAVAVVRYTAYNALKADAAMDIADDNA